MIDLVGICLNYYAAINDSTFGFIGRDIYIPTPGTALFECLCLEVLSCKTLIVKQQNPGLGV